MAVGVHRRRKRNPLRRLRHLRRLRKRIERLHFIPPKNPMSEESKPAKRGCLARLISTFLFLIALALGVALFFASQAQDLSDIKGYGMAANPAGRDLSQAVAEAVQRGGYEVKI